jgi:hypothetical protein
MLAVVTLALGLLATARGDDPMADVSAYLQTVREHAEGAQADVTRRLDSELEDVRTEQERVWALVNAYTETLKAENLARERYRAAAAAVERAKYDVQRIFLDVNKEYEGLGDLYATLFLIGITVWLAQYLAIAVRHHHEHEAGLVGTLAWSTVSALAAWMLDLADLFLRERPKQD